MQNIGQNIRKHREWRNYTQEYMAAELGISQNAYSKIERNTTNLTITRLFQIAKILQVDCIQLLGITPLPSTT